MIRPNPFDAPRMQQSLRFNVGNTVRSLLGWGWVRCSLSSRSPATMRSPLESYAPVITKVVRRVGTRIGYSPTARRSNQWSIAIGLVRGMWHLGSWFPF